MEILHCPQFLVVLYFVLVLNIQVAFAINEDSAKEQPCFNISNAVDPDEKWVRVKCFTA